MDEPLPRPSLALIEAIHIALRALADSGKAAPMQAYMKSEMPFLGVAMPLHRKACRRILREHPLPSFEAWRDTSLALWRAAGFREERYCAIHLINSPQNKGFWIPRALPIYREMIVSGAWWDLVDAIAPYRLGDLLDRYPDGSATAMRRWARSRDVWKRRAAIISQLKRKERTDVELLFTAIEPSIGDSEFFLRKAIGWALREYAKTDPDVVIDYVTENRHRLSALSQREALRNILGKEALHEFLAGSVK